MSSVVLSLIDRISASRRTLKTQSKLLEDNIKKTKKIFKALFIVSTTIDGSLSLACFSISAVAISTGILLTIPTLALVNALIVTAIVAAVIGVMFFLSATIFGIAGIIRNKNYSKIPSTEKPSTSEELKTLKLTNDALIKRFNEEFEKMESILKKLDDSDLISQENVDNLNSPLNSIEQYLKEIISRIEKNDEDFKEKFSENATTHNANIYTILFPLATLIEQIEKTGKKGSEMIGKMWLISLNLLKYCDINKKRAIFDKDGSLFEFPQKNHITLIINTCIEWIITLSPNKLSNAYKRKNLKKFKEELFETIEKLASNIQDKNFSFNLKNVLVKSFENLKETL